MKYRLEDCVPLPGEGQPRNIIIMFDGTGDTEDGDVTNLCLLKKMLFKDNSIQLVRYRSGIGTHNPKYERLDVLGIGRALNIADKMIAYSLKGHLVEAYLWLMENYRPGDKISIFGFSRGAYTARALSGMINSLGLLPDKDPEAATKSRGSWIERIFTGEKPPATRRDLAAEGWDIYSRELPKPADAEGVIRQKEEWKKKEQDLVKFRKMHKSQVVFIDFVGCWDTVNSVGLVRAIQLPSTSRNDVVRVFRHALALDERRVRFKPSRWGQTWIVFDRAKRPRVKTDVKEVWFAGCHCDIGGGSVTNDVRPSLHFLTLRWMIRECFKMETGIIFNVEMMKTIGLDLDEVTKHPRSRTPDELIPDPSAIIQVGKGPSLVAKALGYFPFAEKPQVGPPSLKEAERDARSALVVPRPWAFKPLEIFPFRTDVFHPGGKPGELRFFDKCLPHLDAGRMLSPVNHSMGHGSVVLGLQAKAGYGKEYPPAANIVKKSLKNIGGGSVRISALVGIALSYFPFRVKRPAARVLEPPTMKEAELDAHDALAPIYDQLVLRPLAWQPLELFPLRMDIFQRGAKPGEPRFVEKLLPHKSVGRAMLIPVNHFTGAAGKMLVHKSVLLRLQAKTADGKEYMPAANMVNKSLKEGHENYEKTFPFDPSFVQWVV